MSRILPRHRRHAEKAHDLQRIAAILAETDPNPTSTVVKVTLAGDSRRLRGFPIVARGVAGVSPGSDPVAELLRSVM
jgi:hypothetical protein